MLINNTPYSFLIDTGATKSCLKAGIVPLSRDVTDTNGFSSEVMRVPFTKTLELDIGRSRLKGQMLYHPSSATNLLGWDLMAN